MEESLLLEDDDDDDDFVGDGEEFLNPKLVFLINWSSCQPKRMLLEDDFQ